MKQSFSIKNGPHARAVMANAWGFVQMLHATGKDASVTVATATRSTMQNARMWAMLTEVSDQVDWYGKKLTPDAWKCVFSASLKKQDVVPGLHGDFVVLGQSTSNMTIQEMNDLMTLMEAFGAERDVRFSAAQQTEAA